MAQKKDNSLKLLTERDINKKYNSDRAINIITNNDRRLRLPSRLLWLNDQLGGGLVYGTVNEIFGYESTGKTLLATDFATVAQSLGGMVLWDDAERAFDYIWAQKNGMDLDRLCVLEKNEVESLGDWSRDMALYWRSQLTHNEPILLVCDSIAALETKANINSDMSGEKAQMGNRAKAIYNFYRKRNDLFADLGIITIMINQVRDKVGASLYESAITTPGGGATKFYSSIRICTIRSTQIKGRIAKGKFIEDKQKGRKIGQRVIVKIEKNKTAPPAPQVKTEVYFEELKSGYTGFSKYDGLEEILIYKDIILKKGSRYYYKWKGEMKLICNGADNIVTAIQEDDILRARLIKKAGIFSTSQARTKLESITKNLFPLRNIKKSSLTGMEEDEE